MKGFLINIFLSLLTLGICGALFSRPVDRSEIREEGALPGEPSCEELRAMWRFSRRQSRAAEVTNELPTYRDPFAHNIWEPLPRLRSVLQRRPVSRPWSPPVYGRVVRHPPMFPPPPSAFDELYRELHKDYRNDDDSDRRRDDGSGYRSPVVHSARYNQLNYESPYNSFDRVKQMILAERAKDLSYKKVKPGEGKSVKNAQERNKEEVNGQNSNYNRYSAEDGGKGDKLRLVKGGFDLDTPPASERFRKPLRRSSAYTWMDPTLEEGYWGFD